VRILAITNLYPGPGHPAQGTFVEQQVKGLREIGLEVDMMVIDRTGLGYWAYVGLARRIQARVAGSDYDLVHSMYGGVMGYCAMRQLATVPGVVSFCGSDLLGETLPGLFRRIVVEYGVYCSRRAARIAAGVVVKSENLRQALPRSVRGKARIIPNGVDLGRFRPMARNECCLRLGWNPQSRHALFPANSGSPCKRVWLARAAVKAAETLGCCFEFHALQGVEHGDVPIWINACDVVLLTSDHEGSPNVVKEALACNAPVVSVDVGDVAERLKEVPGCFVVPPEPQSIATKLVKVYRAFSRLRTGRKSVSALSLGQIARRLEAFYREVLGKTAPQPVEGLEHRLHSEAPGTPVPASG